MKKRRSAFLCQDCGEVFNLEHSCPVTQFYRAVAYPSGDNQGQIPISNDRLKSLLNSILERLEKIEKIIGEKDG